MIHFAPIEYLQAAEEGVSMSPMAASFIEESDNSLSAHDLFDKIPQQNLLSLTTMDTFSSRTSTEAVTDEVFDRTFQRDESDALVPAETLVVEEYKTIHQADNVFEESPQLEFMPAGCVDETEVTTDKENDKHIRVFTASADIVFATQALSALSCRGFHLLEERKSPAEHKSSNGNCNNLIRATRSHGSRTDTGRLQHFCLRPDFWVTSMPLLLKLHRFVSSRRVSYFGVKIDGFKTRRGLISKKDVENLADTALRKTFCRVRTMFRDGDKYLLTHFTMGKRNMQCLQVFSKGKVDNLEDVVGHKAGFELYDKFSAIATIMLGVLFSGCIRLMERAWVLYEDLFDSSLGILFDKQCHVFLLQLSKKKFKGPFVRKLANFCYQVPSSVNSYIRFTSLENALLELAAWWKLGISALQAILNMLGDPIQTRISVVLISGYACVMGFTLWVYKNSFPSTSVMLSTHHSKCGDAWCSDYPYWDSLNLQSEHHNPMFYLIKLVSTKGFGCLGLKQQFVGFYLAQVYHVEMVSPMFESHFQISPWGLFTMGIMTIYIYWSWNGIEMQWLVDSYVYGVQNSHNPHGYIINHLLLFRDYMGVAGIIMLYYEYWLVALFGIVSLRHHTYEAHLWSVHYIYSSTVLCISTPTHSIWCTYSRNMLRLMSWILTEAYGIFLYPVRLKLLDIYFESALWTYMGINFFPYGGCCIVIFIKGEASVGFDNQQVDFFLERCQVCWVNIIYQHLLYGSSLNYTWRSIINHEVSLLSWLYHLFNYYESANLEDKVLLNGGGLL